jgi:hypothetical protein
VGGGSIVPQSDASISLAREMNFPISSLQFYFTGDCPVECEAIAPPGIGL